MSQTNNGRDLGVATSKPTLEGLTVGGDALGGSGAATINIGTQTTDTVAFYGTTPATQRAAANQAASVVSATSYISVTSNLAAWAAEVSATLTGLGLWKGSA